MVIIYIRMLVYVKDFKDPLYIAGENKVCQMLFKLYSGKGVML